MSYKIGFNWLSIFALILFCFLGLGSSGFGAENNWTTLIGPSTNGPTAYFWSGKKYGNKIFGGTHNGFEIWSYPLQSRNLGPEGGESAFSFCEFNGDLYVTKEDGPAKVLRLRANGTQWEEVTTSNIDPLNIGPDSYYFFNLTVFDNKLYLKVGYLSGPPILYLYSSSDGDNWTFTGSSTRNSELFTFFYKDYLYDYDYFYSIGAYQVEYYTIPSIAVGSRSTDGQHFVGVPALSTNYNTFYLFGYQDPVLGMAFLGSGADRSQNYDPTPGSGNYARLHRFDGTTRTEVIDVPELQRLTSIVRVGQDLYALADSGYEATYGVSKLYVSYDNGDHWDVFKEFTDLPIATALVNYNGVLVVFGGKGGEGSYGKIVALAVPPTATTMAATNFPSVSPTLNGTVNPQGLATTYYFEWGETKGYGNTTSVQSAGSGLTDVTVSANLSGLTPNKTYHFRLVATNIIGITTKGSDVSFYTGILITPWGTMSLTTPTYYWFAVSNATQYRLYIDDSTGNRVDQWYTTAEVGCASGTGICSFTPSVVLAQGEGSWKIKTRNEIGDGPWSSTLDFTIDDTWAPKVDFNNDGKTDILWRNNTTGGALAWFMDGTMILNPTNWIHQGVSLQWEIAAP